MSNRIGFTFRSKEVQRSFAPEAAEIQKRQILAEHRSGG